MNMEMIKRRKELPSLSGPVKLIQKSECIVAKYPYQVGEILGKQK